MRNFIGPVCLFAASAMAFGVELFAAAPSPRSTPAAIPLVIDRAKPWDARSGMSEAIGGTDTDRDAANLIPATYAWELFMVLNQEADGSELGRPATACRFPHVNPDHATVWETWPRVSGGNAAGPVSAALPGNKSQVELNGGVDPGTWNSLAYSDTVAKALEDFHLQADGVKNLPEAAIKLGITPFYEIRVNKAGFEYELRKETFSVVGLDKFIAPTSVRFVTFPAESKFVKACWIPIAEAQKPGYRWRVVDGQLLGLAGMHIMSREKQAWFFTTFLHEDYLGYVSDLITLPDTPERVASEIQGSVWENYRLLGAQFPDTGYPGSKPIQPLANPLIDFSPKGSCYPCHKQAFYAGVDPSSGRARLTGAITRSRLTDSVMSVTLRAMAPGDYQPPQSLSGAQAR